MTLTVSPATGVADRLTGIFSVVVPTSGWTTEASATETKKRPVLSRMVPVPVASTMVALLANDRLRLNVSSGSWRLSAFTVTATGSDVVPGGKVSVVAGTLT